MTEQPEQPDQPQPEHELPVPEQPVPEQSDQEQRVPAPPTPELPVPEQPDHEQPVAEQPVPEQPVPEQPDQEQPAREQHVPEPPDQEQPVRELPVPEQPDQEQPVPEQHVPDQPVPEHPVAIPSPIALAARERAAAQARQHTPGPSEFGRVDEGGTVYVRTRDGERAVGQWPTSDTRAALAFYGKRFDGLSVEVDLLVRRINAASITPDDAASSVAKLKTAIREAQAVGDLDGLLAQLDALAPLIAERRDARRAERAAKAEDAKRQKEQIAADAEKLAQSSDWRAGANRLRDLLLAWKALPRIDRATDDELWHRFSAARTTYTRRRKQHFAELSTVHDEARAAKEKLITEAEALSSSTEWGATSAAYRDLMTRWKAAGPASKDVDDSLWKRFRSAQDTFFEARDAAGSKQDQEFTANAVVKRGLLEEAERLVPVTDPKSARTAFRVIAEKWDAAGKVPRADVRELENRFKAVEATIRGAEDDTWRRSNPEVHARASETVRKLEAALESLRVDLARAQAAGNAKAMADVQASIEARQLWLDQARRSQSEFGP